MTNLNNNTHKLILDKAQEYILNDYLINKRIKNIHLPAKHFCSRFAINVAIDLFDWKVSYNEISGNAWDLKYNPNYTIVWDYKNGNVNKDGFLPGMLFGIYNKLSKYNGIKDLKNNSVEYTHIALYLGKFSKKYLFIHLYDSYSEIISYDDLFSKESNNKYLNNCFKIKEILMFNKNINLDVINKIKKELI